MQIMTNNKFRFDLRKKEKIKACKPILERLYKNHKKKYIELFFHEKDMVFEEFSLEHLVKAKILRKIGKKFRANVQVFPLSGKFICTDFIISTNSIKNGEVVRGREDVWGILTYESPYIAKKAIVEKNNIVLDLATGSGIIALFCADKAKKVIATDINPKAINYAKFNAILNGAEDKIEFRLGDMFKPIKDMRFDLIIWNGATLALPGDKEKYPVYCYGGYAGSNMTRKFIEEAPKHLTRKGKMQWLDPSLGTEKESATIKHIKEKWKNKNFKIVCEERVPPDDLFKVIDYCNKRLIYEPIRGRPKTPLEIKTITKGEVDEWMDLLKKRGYTHINALMIKVYPSTKFKIVKTKPKKIVFKRMNYLPAEWHFLSYQRILQLLKICEEY